MAALVGRCLAIALAVRDTPSLMTPDDPDIFRAAKLLMHQHGQHAPRRAARRADKLLQAGDMERSAAWQRIREVIEERQRDAEKGNTTLSGSAQEAIANAL